MATEGPVLAKNLMLYMNGQAYGCMTDVELNIDREVIELACKDGDSIKAGKRTITGTLSGLFAFDHTLGAIHAAKEIAKDDPDTAVIRFGTDDDDEYLEFNAIITNFSLSGGVEGAATYSCTYQGTDGILYTSDNPQSTNGEG